MNFEIMTKRSSSKIRIGITVGDLNGIGPELVLKLFSDNRICELCQPVALGSKQLFQSLAKTFHFNDLNISYVNSIEDVKGKSPSVLQVWDEAVEVEFGKESYEAGSYALKSLEAAIELLKSESIDAIVTAPINKKTIQSDNFTFPGHTEYLQSIDKVDQSLMLMISEYAKIGVVTGHIPLSDVKAKLTTESILSKLSLFNRSLKEDFGIRKPKIALLGLNPHAGDQGLLGKEEQDIILPAIQQAKTIDILAFGPYPADGFFASAAYKNFDGILAMYHDQGLIPAKMLSFRSGVNFTAGLSFVRTSPDHGTAFDIAGKGIADESSLRSALYQAIEIVKTRSEWKELHEDVLQINKSRS
tara:strand:- start:1792 stop:2865 length:1074 start_codon:yes stop_codon:yes gene_type:complete